MKLNLILKAEGEALCFRVSAKHVKNIEFILWALYLRPAEHQDKDTSEWQDNHEERRGIIWKEIDTDVQDTRNVLIVGDANAAGKKRLQMYLGQMKSALANISTWSVRRFEEDLIK